MLAQSLVSWHTRARRRGAMKQKESERLSREQLRKQFGIEPLPTLTQAEAEECAEINALFDAVVHERGIREWQIFKSAYKGRDAEALRALLSFLQNVRSCPEAVRVCAQHLLNEKA